ncbi:MAG TPA: tryptophan 7-halogenase, partial [Actinoplanes sp.]|nr:tryptophan 7-halogenase [Actinoplanes sp.]
LRYDGTRWDVDTTVGAPVRARVLVDATGRRAAVGRAVGARRLTFDRLVGVAVTWIGTDPDDQHYLLVETGPDGWWYTAPLPGGRLVGTLMTDADLCRRAGLAKAAPWQQRLRTTTATAARVGERAAEATPRVHPAVTARLVRHGDPRPWLAVGDAALAVDPVSGAGVLHALRTAADAAGAVAAMLARPSSAPALIGRYEAARDDECTHHLVRRRFYYGSERRYVSPFWLRRAAATST